MRHQANTNRRRNAFTLIELLVVMVLILVIAALGLGYVVFGQDNQHSVNGAQALTGALLNAKQRARRDGLPTGVRILFATPGLQPPQTPVPTEAGQLELIQQPEDYNAGVWTSGDGVSNPIVITGADFQGGASFAGQIDESTVQAGDYFVVAGTTLPHLITKVVSSNSLMLASSAGTTTNIPYNIVRAPRRLPSEDVVQLPSGIVIDNGPAAIGVGGFTYCQNIPTRTLMDGQSTPMTVAEILFSPAGAVVGQGTQADKIYLWLRDSNHKLDPQSGAAQVPGAPLILAVQTRTGLIGVYPVAPWTVGTPISAGNDPYANVRTPRSSGL
jgi:prepilin-type N-terminal cleavage/methylation domain-containing protein